MAPKISAEMRIAIELMRTGATAYKAAKLANVSASAISKARNKKWFVELMSKAEAK